MVTMTMDDERTILPATYITSHMRVHLYRALYIMYSILLDCLVALQTPRRVVVREKHIFRLSISFRVSTSVVAQTYRTHAVPSVIANVCMHIRQYVCIR